MGKSNWSGDLSFITDLNTLKQKYIEADFMDDLPGKVKYLGAINLITQPKVDVQAELKKIKWVRDNLSMAYFTDPKTKMTGTNPTNIAKLNEVMLDIMTSMLKKLQDAGIYTQNAPNLKTVLGEFGSS